MRRRSKLLAERRAYELCGEQSQWSLVTIQPPVVQGPPPGGRAVCQFEVNDIWPVLLRQGIPLQVALLLQCQPQRCMGCRECEVRGGGLHAEAAEWRAPRPCGALHPQPLLCIAHVQPRWRSSSMPLLLASLSLCILAVDSKAWQRAG